MPIYEYECTEVKCKEVTEKLVKMSEADDKVPCKTCGEKTEKKVSRTSFQLKGGGWESDGYAG